MADYTPIKPAANAKDLTGRRYVRLTVVMPVGVAKCGHILWLCKCDCGGERVATTSNLGRNTMSCGCLQRECNPPRMVTHGRSKTRQYGQWEGIVGRCENPKSRAYKDYGGRGIKMCDRWRRGDGARSGFECFIEDMGERPSPNHSIERIDNDGNYEPSNCRWATRVEQQNNMRNTIFIEIDGRTQSMCQWAREMGLKPSTVSSRIGKGWDPATAVMTPLWGKRN